MEKIKKISKSKTFWFMAIFFVLAILLAVFLPSFLSGQVSYKNGIQEVKKIVEEKIIPKPDYPPLDKVDYDNRMVALAHNPPPPQPTTKIVKDPTTGAETTVIIPAKPAPINIWPAKTVYPKDGAILPFHRVIAFYGNLYSRGMGVLGEYPEDIMLAKLQAEVDKWNAADPTTPALPALHYIAVTAQGSPGESGMYRLRMPGSEIDKVIAMAEKIHGIVFLDVQVGFSTVQAEVPLLEKYLKMPNVHLGIDPEFSMKSGIRPGKVVGTYDAADVNFVAGYLAKLVKENDLPPKILVVHRYTQKMVTNYQLIKPLPEVQIVMHMDGWGGGPKKINTYQQFIYKEPVQFTGFKLFYKNDVLTPGTVLMTPTELLRLQPKPIYIQYQ